MVAGAALTPVPKPPLLSALGLSSNKMSGIHPRGIRRAGAGARARAGNCFS